MRRVLDRMGAAYRDLVRSSDLDKDAVVEKRLAVLHTLYIDRPMRDHGLLQAIARVNRVFGEKDGGLVVDYVGIGADLRASLRAYDGSDRQPVYIRH